MKYNLFWGDSHFNIRTHQIDFIEETIMHAQEVLDFLPIAYYPFFVYDHQGLQVETDTDRNIFHKHWERVSELIHDYNNPGSFVTFLGYEWHGNRRYYGDHNVIYYHDFEPLVDYQSLEELYEHLRKHKGIAIPHHVAYKVHQRGKDWNYFDPELSPIVEMYSMHGSSEGCNTPFTLNRNQSMGPREYKGSIQAGFERGYKFGLIASGDNHMGVPGYWGNGLMAVYAESLTRESLWKAFQSRRTYAVTGDRIKLKFGLTNGLFMGDEAKVTPPYKFYVCAEGSSAIDRIDLVKNNQLINSYVHFDKPFTTKDKVRFKIRMEFGWGPEDYLNKQWNEWQGRFKINSGEIIDLESAYTWLGQKTECINEQEYNWNLKTKAREHSQHLTFTVEAPLGAVINIECNGETTEFSVKKSLKYPIVIAYTEQAKATIKEQFGLEPDQIENPDHFYHHAFKLKIHRSVIEQDYQVKTEFIDQYAKGANWYYVRVYQRNGQMAWSSPIWLSN